MGRRGLALVIALGLAACAADPSPKEVLTRYRDALARQDAAAIARLHGAPGGPDGAEIASWLEAHPDEAAALEAELAGSIAIEGVELTLSTGSRISLIRQHGTWRVRSGGVESRLATTPLGALARFFSAIDAGALAQIREAIPEAQQVSLGDDAALLAHLAAIAPRVQTARAYLEPLSARTVVEAGDRAEIPYAPGRSVRLVRESDQWRIVDLE